MGDRRNADLKTIPLRVIYGAAFVGPTAPLCSVPASQRAWLLMTKPPKNVRDNGTKESEKDTRLKGLAHQPIIDHMCFRCSRYEVNMAPVVCIQSIQKVPCL